MEQSQLSWIADEHGKQVATLALEKQTEGSLGEIIGSGKGG